MGENPQDTLWDHKFFIHKKQGKQRAQVSPCHSVSGLARALL